MVLQYGKMNSEFQRCLDNRKLTEFKPAADLIGKELRAAEYDILRARSSYDNKDPKWATIQAYYSMFHAARALVFHKGYREKSHRCLLVALVELYVDRGELAADITESFQEAMDMREHADYGFIYNDQTAQKIIKNADNFIKIARKLLKIK